MLEQVFADDLQVRVAPKPRTLLTVRQFAEKHRCFTEPALRNLIFFAQPRHSSKGRIPDNGLAPAIIRVGRKVLIDEGVFSSG